MSSSQSFDEFDVAGYRRIRAARSANSKSAKSKPGTTVQPIRLKPVRSSTVAPNQQPARIGS